MKKLFLVLFLLASVYCEYRQPEKFQVFSSAAPNEYLVVEISSEMDGQRIINCMAIFENDHKYRLVDPRFDKIDIQKSNNSLVKVRKVKKVLDFEQK